VYRILKIKNKIMKHKPLCLVVSILLFIGALNWGLVGIGGFLNMDLNVVDMLFGSFLLVANILYVLIGLAGIAFIVSFFRCPDCCSCKSCGTKKEEKPAEEAPAEPAEGSEPAEPTTCPKCGGEMAEGHTCPMPEGGEEQ
jgi:uncharacterized membrane protein YuzA (DUF378 family)